MKLYKGGTKFKKEVLKVLCNQLNIDEIRLLSESFVKFDQE